MGVVKHAFVILCDSFSIKKTIDAQCFNWQTETFKHIYNDLKHLSPNFRTQWAYLTCILISTGDDILYCIIYIFPKICRVTAPWRSLAEQNATSCCWGSYRSSCAGCGAEDPTRRPRHVCPGPSRRSSGSARSSAEAVFFGNAKSDRIHSEHVVTVCISTWDWGAVRWGCPVTVWKLDRLTRNLADTLNTPTILCMEGAGKWAQAIAPPGCANASVQLAVRGQSIALHLQ